MDVINGGGGGSGVVVSLLLTTSLAYSNPTAGSAEANTPPENDATETGDAGIGLATAAVMHLISAPDTRAIDAQGTPFDMLTAARSASDRPRSDP